MDTEKLFKAIQIVVKEEVKKQLSTIREEVKKEILKEIKQSSTTNTSIKKTKTLKDVVSETNDPFELANKILAADREQPQYSKNPMINNILNETRVRPNFSKDDGEWGTITPDMVGYGDVRGGYQSQVQPPMTGNDAIDAAIARSAKVLAASKDKRR